MTPGQIVAATARHPHVSNVKVGAAAAIPPFAAETEVLASQVSAPPVQRKQREAARNVSRRETARAFFVR